MGQLRPGRIRLIARPMHRCEGTLISVHLASVGEIGPKVPSSTLEPPVRRRETQFAEAVTGTTHRALIALINCFMSLSNVSMFALVSAHVM